MSHNIPQIEDIYESDQGYMLSEESSLFYKNPYFFESQQAQIEQQHYGLTDFQGPPNHIEIPKQLSANLHTNNNLLNDDFQSPSGLRRHYSVYAMIGEKGEEISDSIFSGDNSNSDSDFNSSEIKAPNQKKTPRRQLQKRSKKPQQRVFKQIKSQSSQISNSRTGRNTSSPIRKGKHSQSKTQKFIFFFTQFHYSKNFSQFLKKKTIQKTGKLAHYSKSTPDQKIDIIDEIIDEIGEYRMAVHYKVQESQFMENFTFDQKNLIREFFWKVVQRTYRTRLELEKKYIELEEEEARPERRRFFDEKGEAEFNKIFDSILTEQPFNHGLDVCNFEPLLEDAMKKMSKKQMF